MTKPLTSKAKHNRRVRELRDLGIIPYQDGSYKPKIRILTDETRWKAEAKNDYERIKVSKNGSILPNKFACW